MLIAYASRTGTRRNLQVLRDAGWRLLVSAAGCLRTEGFRYALDNGAWSAHCKGTLLDEGAFAKALDLLGTYADWVVVPDIVAGGHLSLALSTQWLPRVLNQSPCALLAVQDGMMVEDIAHFLGPHVGIFVGGSTAWKEATLPQWGALARQIGCWCHVGRVNTVRRIHLCGFAGVTSFDGSSASRYAVNTPRLDHARRQLVLPLE